MMTPIHSFMDKEQRSLPFIADIATNDLYNSSYRGIILNSDKNILSFIDVGLIENEGELRYLIKFTLEWWWYSNSNVPVNLFYPDKCSPYMKYVKHISQKSVAGIKGHVTSLQQLLEKTKSYKKNVPVSTNV